MAYTVRVMVNHMRHTRAHTGNRRSHHALKNVRVTVCEECGAPKKPHRVCLTCGTYKGKKIVDVHARLEKREKKRKEKAKAGEAKA